MNFSIQRGEVVSILGESGVGKSTLLSVLSGLENADSGSIDFDGEHITDAKEKKLAVIRNRKIGFVFQFHHLLRDFTAEENIAMPLLIQRQSHAMALEKARASLSAVGLSDRAKHKPGELSGGEQQRVAIARAMVTNPVIVFADEPTGNLDSQNADQVHQLLMGANEKSGTTLVIVTHNERLAKKSHRMVWLHEGKIHSSNNRP